MKINSGIYKYRRIEIPEGIRPTTEKVREAVFSMIAAWIPGARVLDLFAGSGSMGLEALSRGAAHCWFCEINRKNQKVLMSNIENCGAENCSTISGGDYRAAIAKMAGEAESLDVVLIDPPYEQTSYYKTAMNMLQEYGLLDEDSIVVAEYYSGDSLPDSFGNLRLMKSKKYGTAAVNIYVYKHRTI